MDLLYLPFQIILLHLLCTLGRLCHLNRLCHPASLSSSFQLGSTIGKHQQKIRKGKKERLGYLFFWLPSFWAMVWQWLWSSS